MDSYPRLKHFAEPFACTEHSIDHAERHIGNGMRVTGYFFRFSGDGDFRSLVEAIQRRGVHVTVVSSNASQPPMDCRRVAAGSGCLYRFG
jgi:hypothetical protein